MSKHKTPSQRVGGLVLAAGESTRMGTPKQLLPVNGMPLVCWVVTQALSSRLHHIVVVLGHVADEVTKALEEHRLAKRVTLVYNDRYTQGMGTSIAAGLQVLKDDFDHVMIILADMPHINSGLIDLLLLNYFDSDKDLAAVEIQGRRSHPVVFSKRYFSGLLKLDSDTGGKEIFLAHKESALLVDPGPAYREIDLDTPRDYHEFQKMNRD